MQEIIEQVLDYLKGIWLKRRFIMLSTWLICPIAWVFISQLDNVYESEARVFADTQSILRPLLKGLAVSSNPDRQIGLMVKTLLSRPNLEKIARLTDMDILADTPKKYEGMIEELKNGIAIKKTGGRGTNIFTITYRDKDPEMAKSVVNSVLQVFIENTLGDKRVDADSAQKFIDSQINEYENRLLAAESRLTSFKQKYSGVLPGQTGGFYMQLSNAKQQLKIVELTYLEQETQLKSAKAQLNSSPKTTGNASNKIQNSNSIQTAYDDRISELEATLDSLQLRYTEKHPDVKEVTRRLAHLNKQRTKEIDDYFEAADGTNTQITSSTNPVIQQLQIQINQLESNLASTGVRVDEYRKKVQTLESKIHVLPEIEAELKSLDRDYGIVKSKYEELLKRKESAAMAQQADESTNPIQFRVINPPRAPTAPAGPKRILLYIATTIVGVGVGVGISLLISQINPVVTSSSQISRATGFPVFGVVSATENLGLQRWNRRKTLIFIISNTLLLVILALFIVHTIAPNILLAPIKGIM